MERIQVEELVLGVLKALAPRGTSIKLNHKPFEELKLTSDDSSAMAID